MALAVSHTRSRRVPRRPTKRNELAAAAKAARAAPARFEREDILETLGGHWWRALDAARVALGAATGVMPARELGERAGRLRLERQNTIEELDELARTMGVAVGFSHLMASRADLRRLLGLPESVSACVFNLDGILVVSAPMHAAAWVETFDEFLTARVERTHGRFAPFSAPASFNPQTDYPRHMHAQTRRDGVRAFLASRGIVLPEGDPQDSPGSETVYGLANRKQEALLRRVEQERLVPLKGARQYLQSAHDAGIRCAAVSASANADLMLARAGLAGLIEQLVDGNTIVSERLRARPAPDIPLAACRKLGVAPERSAMFDTTTAGIAAAQTAGFELVVRVDFMEKAGAHDPVGADRVISGIAELLEDRHLHGISFGT